jgi:RNA-binding protein 48
LHEYPSDEFHEAVLIKFSKIQNARCAKIKLDKYNFYGNCLHVCYVPEYESTDDLREKLNERKNVVHAKCSKYGIL